MCLSIKKALTMQKSIYPSCIIIKSMVQCTEDKKYEKNIKLFNCTYCN